MDRKVQQRPTWNILIRRRKQLLLNFTKKQFWTPIILRFWHFAFSILRLLLLRKYLFDIFSSLPITWVFNCSYLYSWKINFLAQRLRQFLQLQDANVENSLNIKVRDRIRDTIGRLPISVTRWLLPIYSNQNLPKSIQNLPTWVKRLG